MRFNLDCSRCAAIFLAAILSLLVGQFKIDALRAVETESPNIVFIMIDDLGWMDLACQGNKLVETPNLDRLARQGMRFTNAYAAAPVCSPTRAAIMTGLAPARLKITNHIPDRDDFVPEGATLRPAPMLDRLPHEHQTIAERLRSADYATGFVGKWHLAGRGDRNFFADRHGFQLNVGGCHLGGPPTFFDPYKIPTIEDRRKGEYLPNRLADESIQFMRDNQTAKFMLFLWPYTVHWPMEAPDELLAKYANRTGPGLNDTRYGAMIEAMDAAVGRVLDELDHLKLSERTLVVFTSDNGGYGGVSDCRPLRESKGYLYEGGIRVPLIVRWPGHVQPNTLCHAPVISMDFYATILEATGAESSDHQPQSDGTSLLPLFRGAKQLEREAIYFHYPNYAWHKSNRLGGAIRQGDLKLIENFDDGSLELYDLARDIGEAKNLASEMKDKATELHEQLVAWRKIVDANMPVMSDE